MKKIILSILITVFIILEITLSYEPLKSKVFSSDDSLDSLDLPWIFLVIESVCFLYYEIPKDLDTIIQISEKCMETNPEYFEAYPGSMEEIRDITIPNLKKYKNRLFKKRLHVTFKDESVILRLGGNEISSSLSTLLPCTSEFYVGTHPVEYYRYVEKFENGRYFDKDNFPIIGEKYGNINVDFLSEKKNLDEEMKDSTYKSYMFEEQIKSPIYQFLEYRQGDKLYNFCDKQPLQSSLPYYQKLAELTEKICEKYDLSRIIFMTLDYRE